jgi:IS30 family transposase
MDIPHRLLALQRREVYLKDIAADVGVHPKTVSRALKRGSAPSMVRRRRPSKLDPFKTTVDRVDSITKCNGMMQ